MKKDYEFYQKVKNWDFSKIERLQEKLTDWEMKKFLKLYIKSDSRVLDLGTGGGERVLDFPVAREIIGTDYSPEMIKTANNNLIANGRTDVSFRVMNNLEMDVPPKYFDLVVARNTMIDAKQIYETLKDDGKLLLHGVDKYDCWDLKRIFGRGQGYDSELSISTVDYEQILEAGFKDVEMVPIFEREFFQKEFLMAQLYKTPTIPEFMEEEGDTEKLDRFVLENSYDKGILLKRRYYGITARK